MKNSRNWRRLNIFLAGISYITKNLLRKVIHIFELNAMWLLNVMIKIYVLSAAFYNSSDWN